VSFTTIFPACYAGRWPHIHFEVYPTLASASSVANKSATSQIALPKATCDEVYATAGYETSVRNLSQVSLASDNVFSDGASLELATVTGNVSSGYIASLTVAV
jgi:protocatechuate 3,4-dioxygenase beta subunit